jgi:hypothetical protein
MRPDLITAKLMRPSNMKRFSTPDLENRRRKMKSSFPDGHKDSVAVVRRAVTSRLLGRQCDLYVSMNHSQTSEATLHDQMTGVSLLLHEW